MESTSPVRRKAGRPLSFDKDAALERAMATFWRYGYEGSSIGALTAAMGISAPSLYAAFGDKKQLFLAAVRLYAGDPEVLRAAIEAAPTAFDAARDMLLGATASYTGEITPRGCLLASATASGSAESVDVQHAVRDIRQAIQKMLRDRIARDVENGSLPSRPGPEALAGLVMSVMQGMSVLARDGATRTQLLSVANAALGAWPRPDFAVRLENRGLAT